MRYLRLQVIEDNCTGELGLKLNKNGMPNDGSEAIGGRGMIIAHDILEHQQGLESIGSLEDELIALGGAIYVRGNAGELGSSFYTMEQSLGSDVSRMFMYYENSFMNRPKYTVKKRRKNLYFKDSWEEVVIDSVIASALNDIKGMDDYEDINFNHVEEYLSKSKDLLTYGLYLADKRFGTPHDAFSMFLNIQNAVDNIAIDYEGQEFVLGYSRRKAVIYDVEYDY